MSIRASWFSHLRLRWGDSVPHYSVTSDITRHRDVNAISCSTLLDHWASQPVDQGFNIPGPQMCSVLPAKFFCNTVSVWCRIVTWHQKARFLNAVSIWQLTIAVNNCSASRSLGGMQGNGSSTNETRYLGRAMAQVVSRRPLTAKTWVRARVNPCGIYGGQSGTGTGFSPTSSVSPVNISFQLHSPNSYHLGNA
jgi:hypothetical protein